jgi:hypothetical protein
LPKLFTSFFNSITRIFFYFDIIWRIGFSNTAYIIWYRFTLKTGIRKWFFPQQPFPNDRAFFHPVDTFDDYPEEWKAPVVRDAERIIQGQIRYYSYHWKTVGNPPDWFLNPFNNRTHPDFFKHWTAINDFNHYIGDIKNVWEASRFEWVVTLARAYMISGENVYLNTLNQWLKDWAEKNPLNTGPNWKCGQEASIRVFNLLNAALILKQWDNPESSLIEFIYQHLERISCNIHYAIAQDNNHGTTEAAALFTGGIWVSKLSTSGTVIGKRARKIANQGRRWLENRLKKLVEKDGSFSQHSVNYHRVLLDTLVFSDYWRRKMEVFPFSQIFYKRIDAIVHWILALTDEISGNAPNLGANDGSHLLNNHSCDYRDFRPSIQISSILFQNKKYFQSGPWDEPCYWFALNFKNNEVIKREKTSVVSAGGYLIMHSQDSWGLLRWPMYRFRPSHNDVFHFDLWYKGQNILRDAGSYSYNTGEELISDYFKSAKAHNTISFDDHEQMPRLGRFILAKWIKADHIGKIEKLPDGSNRWVGAYRDFKGNRHERSIVWQENNWIIEDRFSGDFKKAEIVYRLVKNGDVIDDSRIESSWGIMSTGESDCKIKINKGWESLYYWQKQEVDELVFTPGKSNYLKVIVELKR